MSRISFLTPLSSVDPADRSGLRYPMNLARAAARSGEHQVSLVTIDPVGKASSEVLQDGVRLCRLPAARRRENQQRLSWGVIEAARGADLLHVDRIFSRASEVAVLAGSLAGKRICASELGSELAELGRPADVLSLVDVVVTPSAARTDRVRCAPKVEVVPVGVDSDFFTPARGNVPERRILVLTGARPGSDAIEDLAPKGVEIAMCGPETPDEDARDLFRRAIAVAQLPPEGPNSEISLSLLEAMSCAAPVICGAGTLWAEYLEPGVSGFTASDHRHLREQVESLRDDPELVSRIGRAAREKIVGRCSLDVVGAQLNVLYSSLLTGVQ